MMTDNNEIIKQIGLFLKNNDDFLITAHYGPDGDNIGSCIGIYLALNRIGKKAVIVNEDKFVGRYEFLFGDKSSSFIQYSDDLSGKKYKNVVVLDTATYERIGKVRNIIED
ncbi:MAG: hypothetical protein KKD38_01935, partial [Candidatus Delongbacteria bacterium]|nr:hypothetical protein [Candidatus Delongbacteria bacterium]